MKTIWLKEDESDLHGTIPDGVKTSESEAVLLHKLVSKLSMNDLREKGFTDPDALTIMGWYHELK